MSKKDRTIAFYSMYLADKKTDDMYENESISKIMKTIISYVGSIEDMNDRKIEKKSDNKIFYLENVEYDEEKENIAYLTFISAKYNHVPEFVNTKTMELKKSNKTSVDGDKEYTHIGLLLKDTEVVMIHEQRINGTPKSVIEDYFKKFFKQYLDQKNIKVDYYLAIEIIPDKNFVEELRAMKRINMGTIVMAKSKVGIKAFERFAGRGEIQENVQLTFKSEAQKTIDNNDILEAYNNRSKEKIKRIIIHGFNEKGRVKLDTEPIKTIEKIEVELNNNGIVEKNSIQKEFKKLLEGMISDAV